MPIEPIVKGGHLAVLCNERMVLPVQRHEPDGPLIPGAPLNPDLVHGQDDPFVDMILDLIDSYEPEGVVVVFGDAVGQKPDGTVQLGFFNLEIPLAKLDGLRADLEARGIRLEYRSAMECEALGMTVAPRGTPDGLIAGHEVRDSLVQIIAGHEVQDGSTFGYVGSDNPYGGRPGSSVLFHNGPAGLQRVSMDVNVASCIADERERRIFEEVSASRRRVSGNLGDIATVPEFYAAFLRDRGEEAPLLPTHYVYQGKPTDDDDQRDRLASVVMGILSLREGARLLSASGARAIVLGGSAASSLAYYFDEGKLNQLVKAPEGGGKYPYEFASVWSRLEPMLGDAMAASMAHSLAPGSEKPSQPPSLPDELENVPVYRAGHLLAGYGALELLREPAA